MEESGKSGRRLTLRSGVVLDADIVAVCIGMKPNTQLLEDAGAALMPNGAVRVNSKMASTLHNVYACGRAVVVPHAVSRRPWWFPQASIVERTAQIAGRNAAVGVTGRHEEIRPVAGTAILQIADQWFGRTGLTEEVAVETFGLSNVEVFTVHGYSCARWLGGDHTCVRLVVDTDRGRVVGGAVGRTRTGGHRNSVEQRR